MNGFDWLIIIVYGCGMIGLSIWIGRSQASHEDYFVGGRNLPWWAVGLSTMATQTSAMVDRPTAHHGRLRPPTK